MKNETKQQELKLPEPKKVETTEPDFGSMDMKQLREAYAEMQLTCADFGAKTADLPETAVLSDVRQQCANMHRFIQVRKTQTGKGASTKPSKATRQQAASKKDGPKSAGAKAAPSSKPAHTTTDKETTMTKKTAAPKKAKAPKKAVAPKKASAPKEAKWAGFPLTAKVTVVNKENPAREGTGKWKRWNALLTGGTRTIEALKKAKINSGTLKNAVKSRHVKVA